jgi:uncharacterized protein
MALAQRQEPAVSAREIIGALEASLRPPESALRQAVACADAIAPAILDVVKLAATRIYLVPKQENLLLWGIHALAAARRTELYAPLLFLMRQLTEPELDELFGDVTTETLPGVILSVFDGDATSLVEMCSDSTIDGLSRWTLLGVLARLTFDGRVPRQQTVDLLTRFEREQLAKPDDPAWEGWQQAVILLGVEELRDRMHATWKDGRNPRRKIDCDADDLELSKARAMAPGDPTLFLQERLTVIDDPVAALARFAAKPEGAKDIGLSTGDPAELLALTFQEIEWLAGFFDHVHAPGHFETIDGFFCGLIAGPGLAKPDNYLPKIWGINADGKPAESRYESQVQSEYIVGLLTRHWNAIARRLDGSYPHMPVLDHSSDLPRALPWALGFLYAMSQRHDAWKIERPGDDFVGKLVVALMALAGRENELVEKLSRRERNDFIEILPHMLQSSYDIWHRQRDPLVRPSGTTPFDGKYPRNAACPCGSGKKFKRCCGSADKLDIN